MQRRAVDAIVSARFATELDAGWEPTGPVDPERLVAAGMTQGRRRVLDAVGEDGLAQWRAGRQRPVSWHWGNDVPSLAALRREKGWTAAQLSRASGVEEQLIQRLEDGSVQRVARGHMERLADALGVDPSAVAEFRPGLGLAAIGETGAGDGAKTGARPNDV